jgi:flagellar motor switch protein FliG
MDKKNIVVTAYGHDQTIDRIAVNLFDCSEDCHNGKADAQTYCDTMNNPELKDDSWVFAQIITENTQHPLDVFLPPLIFSDLVIKSENMTIQRALREVKSYEIAKALKSTNEAVQEKIFGNMTKRASQMIKEDMEYMGPVRLKDVEESQRKIGSIIRLLSNSNAITGDELVSLLIKSEKYEP